MGLVEEKENAIQFLSTSMWVPESLDKYNKSEIINVLERDMLGGDFFFFFQNFVKTVGIMCTNTLP